MFRHLSANDNISRRRNVTSQLMTFSHRKNSPPGFLSRYSSTDPWPSDAKTDHASRRCGFFVTPGQNAVSRRVFLSMIERPRRVPLNDFIVTSVTITARCLLTRAPPHAASPAHIPAIPDHSVLMTGAVFGHRASPILAGHARRARSCHHLSAISQMLRIAGAISYEANV